MPKERDPDILIVDHFDERRSIHRGWLERAGYRCEEAPNNRVAYTYTNRRAYGLVVSELVTPNWDAIDLAVSMHLVNPSQRLLIIASSGLPDGFEREIEGVKNVAGYIDGAVNEEKLVRLVRSCLAENPATG